MPIDVQGYNVPETPINTSEALDRMNANMWRQREWQYRMYQQQQEQQLHKANLIDSLTDLTKYKTGNDVADALGNRLMKGVIDKYTQNAQNMSYLDLVGGLKRDTSGILSGLQGVRDELMNADVQLKNLKQAHPEIDTSTMQKVVMNDIVHRHLNDDGSDFDNPMSIANKKASFDLSDPNFLAKYVKGTPSLDKDIDKPQVDPTYVAAGSDLQHDKYKANIPYFAQPSYTDKDLQSGGGYLHRGTIPTMSVKSELMPTQFLPSLVGSDRKMVTPEVYKEAMGRYPLSVISGTQKMFPTYDNMNSDEQEMAQRDYLYQRFKGYEGKPFSYDTNKNESAAMYKILNNIQSGGKGGGGEATINDVYGDVKGKMDDDVAQAKGGIPYTRISKLDAKSQPVVLKLAQTARPNDKIDQSNIYLRYNKDNVPSIYKVDGDKPSPNDTEIMPLDYTGVNLKNQPNVKSKTAVVAHGDNQPTNSMYSIKGKQYTEKQLTDMGYNLDQIAPYKNK